MVHAPGVGWTPDTESHDEQEAHWTAVTEMWERAGQTIREAARAHRGPPLADQGHPRRGQRIARSLAHRLLMALRDAFASRHRNAGGDYSSDPKAGLWRPWKRPRTRAKRLMQRGLDPGWAWRSTFNGRGPWWNAGASHMNDAYRTAFFVHLSAVPHWTAPPCQSCLTNRRIRVRTYGGVGGGGREASSYPIAWL